MHETRPSIADKRRAFQQLHEAGCFVIPNPWDVGSARFLQSLGFKALATTSSGFAWSQGHPDGAVPRDVVLSHLEAIVTATDLPVNADARVASRVMRQALRKASVSPSRPGWRDCR
jgi:2-methylisocitrate lyase-like PEP mutase family enzyme